MARALLYFPFGHSFLAASYSDIPMDQKFPPVSSGQGSLGYFGFREMTRVQGRLLYILKRGWVLVYLGC